MKNEIGTAESAKAVTVDTESVTSLPQWSAKATYSRNVFVTLLRVLVVTASGIVLPSFLTHHLDPLVYGGWILMLQVSNYVGYLDFGIQTAISKYVAQYDASDEHDERDAHASTGAAITWTFGAIGIGMSITLSVLVPLFFRQMPHSILIDVQKGVLLIGISTAVLLASSVYGAVFLGLQRYSIPTYIAIAGKVLYVLVIIVSVRLHQTLTTMGAGVAVVNLLTALAQYLCWRIFLSKVRIARSRIHKATIKRMLGYCAILGIWIAGTQIISGLDTTIVGHYDFHATAFYAVAATPVTFLSFLVVGALSPLTPAVSALSTSRDSYHLGELLVRITRYTTLLVILGGMPLIIFGYPVLTLWVGPLYAQHGLLILRFLVLAHIVRNICGPYSTMVIATAMQRVATLSIVCESISNVALSIILGKHYGSIGVAGATLIGACIGIFIHFTVSMAKTQGGFSVSPFRLLRLGVLLPAISAIPGLLLMPFFWSPAPVHYSMVFVAIWIASTLSTAWPFVLTTSDREMVLKSLNSFLKKQSS